MYNMILKSRIVGAISPKSEKDAAMGLYFGLSKGTSPRGKNLRFFLLSVGTLGLGAVIFLSLRGLI